MFAVEIWIIDPISKVWLMLKDGEMKWFDTYVEAISYVDGYNSDCKADRKAVFIPAH